MESWYKIFYKPSVKPMLLYKVKKKGVKHKEKVKIKSEKKGVKHK